jgi:hypothetical protein
LELFIDNRDFFEISGKLNWQRFQERAWTTFLHIKQNSNDCAQCSSCFVDVDNVHFYVKLFAI